MTDSGGSSYGLVNASPSRIRVRQLAAVAASAGLLIASLRHDSGLGVAMLLMTGLMLAARPRIVAIAGAVQSRTTTADTVTERANADARHVESPIVGATPAEEIPVRTSPNAPRNRAGRLRRSDLSGPQPEQAVRGSTVGRRTRSRRGRQPVVAMPSASWVQVAPGRYVRVEVEENGVADQDRDRESASDPMEAATTLGQAEQPNDSAIDAASTPVAVQAAGELSEPSDSPALQTGDDPVRDDEGDSNPIELPAPRANEAGEDTVS